MPKAVATAPLTIARDVDGALKFGSLELLAGIFNPYALLKLNFTL